jgi:hypothetical protein
MPSEPDFLNESQRRSLEVTLRLAEKAFNRIEALLAPERQGVLYHSCSSLTPAQEERARALAGAGRRQISELAARFHLQSVQEPVEQRLVAEFSAIWCDLEDTRPERLVRYGDLDPALTTTLEPAIQDLITVVLSIVETARPAQPRQAGA